MNYRPEIDGLRTLAIVPVVIYHLKISFGSGQLVSGGFLGVDVFFVISGYLIASLLLREQAETGSISILKFYQRRARRILPALLLIIGATLAVGWFVMLPSELERLALSTVAALTFLSNLFWFVELGEYGAQSGLLQPMLHTWSLAIEEQFYLVFPLLVLMLKPTKQPRRALYVLSGLLLVSLALSQATTLLDRDLSFYSPVSRAWELLFGAVLALVAFHWPETIRMGPRLGWYLPKLALFTLALSMVLVVLPEVNHPGLVTLPVVLATGALICCSDPKEAVIGFLSSAPIVYVGKLSYSIYLWHFPVFAFGRLVDGGLPDAIAMTGWVVLTMLLSVLGYHFIERPFRFSLSGRMFTAVTGTFVTICAAIVVVFAYTDLASHRRMGDLAAIYGNNEIDNEVLQLRSWSWLDEMAGPEEEISTGNARGPSLDERERLWFSSDETVNLLLIGNSHSKDLFNALHSSDGVRQDFDVARFGIATGFPADQLELLYASPNFNLADWIVISPRYDQTWESYLPALIDALKARGKRVALVGNTPEFQSPSTLPIFDWYVQRYGADVQTDEMNSMAWNGRQKWAVEMNLELQQFAQQADVPYFSRQDLVCDDVEQSCAMVTPEGMKTMYDGAHWTLEGASYFGARAAERSWLQSLTE